METITYVKSVIPHTKVIFDKIVIIKDVKFNITIGCGKTEIEAWNVAKIMVDKLISKIQYKKVVTI